MAATDVPLPFSTLTAITPLDGRYRKDLEPLTKTTSEYALIQTRIALEVNYLILLSEANAIRQITNDEKLLLQHIINDFSLDDAAAIKSFEEKTRHDVKAVELFLREKLQDSTLSDLLEMIHFGITSEDINNLALRIMLRTSINDVLFPELNTIQQILKTFAEKEKTTPMLARTHGQPAVPTTLGKEIAVFLYRLEKEIRLLKDYRLTGKITGAVGNRNALVFAKPEINWQKVTDQFITKHNFIPNPVTIQINPYDDIIAYFQILQRINNILLNLSQDMWRYISDGWFVQVVKKDEVGSSTMPQKVNPIFFENAEGNLGLANALITFFTGKLSITRLQRDLSDSTVARNFGSVLGYSLIAYLNLTRGLNRISPDRTKIKAVLNEDWSILSEAAQTILRAEGIKDAYMLVKELSRGKKIGKEEWQEWIENLPVSKKTKEQLAAITPETYLGDTDEIISIATTSTHE